MDCIYEKHTVPWLVLQYLPVISGTLPANDGLKMNRRELNFLFAGSSGKKEPFFGRLQDVQCASSQNSVQ
jgi:hypothetical protein